MHSSLRGRRQVHRGQRGLAIALAVGLLLSLAIGICLAILYEPGKKHTQRGTAPLANERAILVFVPPSVIPLARDLRVSI